MKILLVNTSDRIGGAAVAANRLLQTLVSHGIEAQLLVRDKITDDENVVTINRSRFDRFRNYVRFILERLAIFINNGFSKSNLFQVSIANTGVDITNHPAFIEADIIHLHWVNQGFLSLKDIHKIVLSGKPVVWTMHDMWCFTGICHYAGDCINFEERCESCPLHQDFFIKMALIRQEAKSKVGNISYVGCSKWIANEAAKSALLAKIQILSIPNPIDTSVYVSTNKEEARKRLGLDPNKQYILFGAAKITDPRKGAIYLKRALEIILSKSPEILGNVELLLLGGRKSDVAAFFPIQITDLGYQNNEAQIALIYSAASIFVIPSLEDNLPNTIMEALACGTPCVGFETGGIPEMIEHQQTGYLAQYKSDEDLAEGILWALNQEGAIANRCVEFVRRNYAQDLVAQQYKELYNRILK
ncbi:MAG: glycosyltransferase family 4 protein [Tannerellaceae bacterium]